MGGGNDDEATYDEKGGAAKGAKPIMIQKF